MQPDSQSASDMAIVDTFTKVIFGEEADFSEREWRIIGALRTVDAEVSMDTLHEMGNYLRALGVAEMIRLVGQVHQALDSGLIATPPHAGSIATGSLHR